MIRNLPKIFFFIPVVLIFLFITPAFALPPATAGIYYVHPDGNDLNSGTENTPQGAWKTIQKAADTIRPGDTVEVQSGTYNESVLISISGESTQPITYRANREVIIDGQNTRAYCLKLHGVNFIKIEGFILRNSTQSGILLEQSNYNTITNNISHNNLSQGIKLDKFSTYNTIANNTLYNNTGGSGVLGNRNCGIYLYNSSNNNTITNNTAYSNGTGIWLEGSSSNCIITNNKTYSNGWGGLLLAGGTNNNTVSYNLSYSNSGFGLEVCYSANNNLIKNNTFYLNQRNGIQLNNSATNNTIKNNIITDNGLSSSSYYGIYIESGSSATISYNDIFNNGYGGNNKYGGIATGTNDISLDPLFKSIDSLNPDFLKLKSIAKGDTQDSPCIDTGDPNDTPSNESGQRVDIGAYDLYVLRPQATYYVRTDGNDLNSGTENTPTGAWATIQKAANTLNPGEIVEVQLGTYNEQVTITRSGLSNQYITFRAQGEVIIDGQNTRAFCIKLDGADYIKIEGLTVRNSTGTGILIDNNANYNIITNNICHNNPSTGIKLDHDSNYNTISKNILYNNNGGPGDWGNRNCGIYVFNVSDYNTVDSNIAYSNGTGIWLEGDSSNCTITNNKTYSNSYIGIIIVGGTNNNQVSNNLVYSNASSGMHIGWSAQNNLIKNNTIYGNSSRGIVLDNTTTNNIIKNNIVAKNASDGIYIESGSSAQLSYNDFFSNGTNGVTNYSGIATLGIGDISVDPYFKSTDSNSQDFLKLKSLSQGDSLESPCIDSGDPNDTPNSQSGKRIDQGAYDEYQHNAIEGGLLAEYYDNSNFTSLKLVRIDPRINFDWGSSTPDASLGVDTFSVRWQGQIKIDYAQSYTFYITTDDGSRVWIDNQLIIDKWYDQGPTEHQATINLTPGFHTIKYEYYENGGGAVAKLYWSSPSINKSLIPSDHLYYFGQYPHDQYLQGGLKGIYSKFTDFNGSLSYIFTRIDPQINFDWGGNMADASLNFDKYTAKWNGKIKIERSDTYTLYTTTDDGVRLWVNNNLIIDAWWDQGQTERQANIYLTPGLYDIELDYYENGGLTVCKLYWSSSTITKSLIPPTNLYYENARDLKDGLYAEYFDNIDFTNCKIKRIDSGINFDWISFTPDSLIQGDTYSVRWTGQVKADYNETYTFYSSSDDGPRIWVDNQLIIDNWSDHNPYPEVSANVYLTEGWHDIKVEYYENLGWTASKLAYSSPSTPKQIIPQDHLRSDQPENIITSSLIYHLESREDIQNPTLGHSGIIVEAGVGQPNFVPGKYKQAVELNGTATDREGIKLSTSDLNKKEGTISFWFKPNWNSDDNQMHRFLTTQWEWNGCLEIFKYHENNCLYFKIVKEGVQHAIVTDSSRKWNAGEWHQLAFSWGPKGMKFYLDANPIPISWTFHNELPYTGPMPDIFASELYLGESNWGGESINAVVDELVISKVQEVPEIIAPTISIVSPSDGQAFSSQPITVIGTVDDDNTIITVNSVEAQVSNGTFTAENVPLILGQNTITAIAVDKWGNAGQDSITVIYDTTAPAPFTVSDDGEYTNSITQLHATWTQSTDPESGIKEYQYAIGTTQGGRDVVDWTSVGLTTEVTRTGLNLIEGQIYFFSVKAINGVDMETVSYSNGIIPDITFPVISITSHSNGQTVTSQPITVRGTIDDNNAKVMVNDVEAYVSNGTFIAEGVYLQLGENEIIAIATDLAKNSSQDSKMVIFDNTGPTIPVITDDGNFTNQQTKLHASWSSSDAESGIVEYKYSIGTAPGVTDVMPWTSVGLITEVTPEGLTLSIGQTYYFNVIAKNGVGLESTNSSNGITVRANSPPQILNIQPLSGHVQDTINFTVEAQDIDKDNLQYQFSIDGTIKQVWSSSSAFPWLTATETFGSHSLKVEVKDGMGGEISQTVGIWLFRRPPSPPN